MHIEILRALNGDFALITFTDKQQIVRNILVDGGPSSAYTFLEKKKEVSGVLKDTIELIKSEGQCIDLLILTHVDNDHINGILNWFEKDTAAKFLVKEVWFNSASLISESLNVEPFETNILPIKQLQSYDTGIPEGVDFERYIAENNIWFRHLIISGEIFERYGMVLQILSPNTETLLRLQAKWEKEFPSFGTASNNDYGKSVYEHIEQDDFSEDKTPHNGSSIAFICCFQGESYMFLGDSHPSVIVESLDKLGYGPLNPLPIDFVKISHHGSSLNTSPELLRYISTNRYIVSTNGAIHKHPHKRLLSRIIKHHTELAKPLFFNFNYPELINKIFTEKDFKDFPIFQAKPIQ